MQTSRSSRSRRYVFSAAVVAAAFVHSSAASADEIAPIEQPGTVVLGFGAVLGQSHGRQAAADGTVVDLDVTQLMGGFRAEVFATPVVTLGGAVDMGWTHISANGDGFGHALFVSPTARLGFYAPLSEHVGFWPYLFGGMVRTDSSYGDPVDAWTFGGSVRLA